MQQKKGFFTTLLSIPASDLRWGIAFRNNQLLPIMLLVTSCDKNVIFGNFQTSLALSVQN